MRIIAGKLRGRKLAAVRGSAVRPTADRVREALFNILAQKPIEATVLDLFSGTGALGLEALSRSARLAIFIDHHPQSLAVLRSNIRLCGLEASTRVIQWDILKNLTCLIPFGQLFDLVFMDPPYHQQMIQPALVSLTHHPLLAVDALVVAEHGPTEAIDPAAVGMQIVDQRSYGRTRLSFLSFLPPDIAS